MNISSRPSAPHTRRSPLPVLLAGVAALLLLTGSVHAQGRAESTAATAGAALPPGARETLEQYARAQTANLPGRVDIVLGAPDARLALAPCARTEAFLPLGSRLWGRSHLGLRCAEGARWSVLVPVEVKVYAQALQAARPLASGQALANEDVALVEAEVTREAPGLLTGSEDLAEASVARSLPAGALLRREHLRPRQIAQAGDPVTLMVRGTGFAVTSAGKLLQAAVAGQAVRVQADSGKILSGIARSGKVVEVGATER